MFLRTLSNFGEMLINPGFSKAKRPIVGAGEIIHDVDNQWVNESAHVKGTIVPDGREVIVPKSYLQPL